jgi:hypothetical protein
MMKNHLFTLFILFCLPVSYLLGQDMNQDVNHGSLSQLYPGEPVIVLDKKDEIIVSYKKGKLGIDIKVSEELMYMNKTARLYNRGSVYHGSFTTIKKIKAYSQIPKKGKKGKYKKVKVRKYESTNVTSSGIFYDDQKELGFDYTGLVEGAKTKLSYIESLSDPKFMGRNFFSYSMPVLSSSFSISVPANVQIGYELINVDTNLIKHRVVQKGKNTTHSWTGKNLKANKMFSNGVDASYYAPHIIIYFKSVQHKDSLVTVLPDTKALYDWYYSIVKGINRDKSEVLKNITDSILKGVTGTEQRAKKIYYWVQDNIKYVAFEDGMGGFVPRDAKLVCQRRFGDCKDMSSIIIEMLGFAGIEGHLTWLGTRDLPYKYSKIHTPTVDNHMIASYNYQGKTIFLDAVGSYTPYGFTTAMIQGKEALIGINENKFQVIEVPIAQKERNIKNDFISLELDNEQLKGKGIIEVKGYSKLAFVYELINLNGAKRKDKLVSILQKGNNKFLIQNAVFEGIDDRDAELELNYNFTLGNYVNKFQDELYINLHLDKSLQREELDLVKREGVPVKFNHTVLDTFKVSFKIPEGYVLQYLPSDESFTNKNFGFSATYKRKNGEVVLEMVYYNNLLTLNKSLFKKWNSMISKVNAVYQENLVLRKR